MQLLDAKEIPQGGNTDLLRRWVPGMKWRAYPTPLNLVLGEAEAVESLAGSIHEASPLVTRVESGRESVVLLHKARYCRTLSCRRERLISAI